MWILSQTKSHTIYQCFALRKQREERATFGQNHGFSYPNVNLVQQMTNHLATVDTIFRPFCSKAVILNSDNQFREVICFRDTGSAQTLVSKKFISPTEFQDTGKYRLIQGITGDLIKVLLVLN